MGLVANATIVCLTAVAVMIIQRLLQSKLRPIGDGFAGPGWRNVSAVFRQNVESGAERGGSFAVYHQGKLVLDMRGGYADVEAQMPWTKDTLSMFFSSTKAVGAITIALLVERGILDYNKPISDYWKDFGQNGKEKITLKMFLSHQAGLAVLDEKLAQKLLITDWQAAGKILAKQKPYWTPGERHGYHATTFGLYLDQIVRRVDDEQRGLGLFFEEEIAKPYGLDFFIGLPFEENYRCARLYSLNLFDELWYKTRTDWMAIPASLFANFTMLLKAAHCVVEAGDPIQLWNRPHYRTIPNCAYSGYGTAASLAKLMSNLAHGRDKQTNRVLLNRNSIKKLTTPVRTGPDLVMIEINMTYTLGLMVRPHPVYKGKFIYGHDGYGGQMAYVDLENDLAWAYTTNHLTNSIINEAAGYDDLLRAVYASLEYLQRSERTNQKSLGG